MYGGLLDYSKKSFRLIFDNPILFLPILINLVITLMFTLTLGLAITRNDFGLSIGLIIIGTLVFILLEVFIGAGKAFMIGRIIKGDKVEFKDLIEGGKKYFSKFLLGSIVIALAFIVGGLLLGLLSLIVGRILGFIIILIVLVIGTVYVTMWFTILIYEDTDIVDAISLSISFAKENFGLLLVVNILQGIFTGNNSSGRYNRNQSGGIENTVSLPLFIAVLGTLSVPLIVMGVILSITMDLFFNVMFFAIYDDRNDSIN